MRAESAILWALQDIYRANPEDLDGVPTNEEITKANADLQKWPKEITLEERKGFLEQWKMGYLRGKVSELTPQEIEGLREELVVNINAIPRLPHELEELRRIQSIAAVAVSNVRE